MIHADIVLMLDFSYSILTRTREIDSPFLQRQYYFIRIEDNPVV